MLEIQRYFVELSNESGQFIEGKKITDVLSRLHSPETAKELSKKVSTEVFSARFANILLGVLYFSVRWHIYRTFADVTCLTPPPLLTQPPPCRTHTLYPTEIVFDADSRCHVTQTQ